MSYQPRKTLSLLLGSLALFSPLWGHTAEDAAAETPHTFAPNLALVSNYIFRGLTQTWNQPALQGGVDYTHHDGWYASLWASNISDRSYADGSAEVDLNVGYNGKFAAEEWTWNVGLASAYYPGANYKAFSPAVATYGSQSYDNLELNGGVAYKWLSVKLSTALTDYYGANTNTGYTSGSQWSSYTDLSANIPLPEELFSANVTLPIHYGHTNYTTKLKSPAFGGGSNPDYNDYKIGISKGFDAGISLSLAVTYADNGAVYDHTTSAKSSRDTIDLGGLHTVLGLSKTF